MLSHAEHFLKVQQLIQTSISRQYLPHFRFSVDGTPIREFKNLESIGVPFAKSQPMRIYSSLWNADDWATQGGRIKTDWCNAPFTASYRSFNANACVMSNGRSSCSSSGNNAWLTQQLDNATQARMKWVQQNYMIYNQCTDIQRFPQGLPKECTFANSQIDWVVQRLCEVFLA